MKKIVYISGMIFITFILSACNSSPLSIPSSGESTSSYSSSSSISENGSSSTSGLSSSSPLSSSNPPVTGVLGKEVITFLSNTASYGNTNGNALNKGLAVYDHIRKLHYFAIGPNVYKFNPDTNQTALLFTLQDAGNVKNLCLTNSHLYFVSSKNNFLEKYDFETNIITTIYEKDTYYVSSFTGPATSNYIFPEMSKISYGDETIQGLGVYSHNSQEFLDYFSRGATTVNISWTKIFYTTNHGSNIETMANTFNGKTTVKRFKDYGIKEIHELLLVSEGTSGLTPRLFALIASKGTQTNLYIYRTETDVLSLVVSDLNIHSLNTDGSSIYFLNEQHLYKYHIDTENLSNIYNLDEDARYLNIINHWIYFSNSSLTTLGRINPDTQLIEQNFWNT